MWNYSWKIKIFFLTKNHCEILVCTILICTLYSIKYGIFTIMKRLKWLNLIAKCFFQYIINAVVTSPTASSCPFENYLNRAKVELSNLHFVGGVAAHLTRRRIWRGGITMIDLCILKLISLGPIFFHICPSPLNI